MGVLKKQISALKLGIEVLGRERRERYAAGEHAWKEGYRPNEIKDPEVSGSIFGFAEEGHKGWVRYTEAIEQFLDMIEALSDADAKIDDQPMLFEEIEDG